MWSGASTGSGAHLGVVMPEKGGRNLRRQTTAKMNSGVDRIVHARALDHAIGNDPFDSGGCVARADLGQGAERPNLLRDRVLKSKTLKPPTEGFKRRDGGDQPSPTGFRTQSNAVSLTHSRESHDQRSVVEVDRHRLVRLDGSDHVVFHS